MNADDTIDQLKHRAALYAPRGRPALFRVALGVRLHCRAVDGVHRFDLNGVPISERAAATIIASREPGAYRVAVR